MLASVKGPWGSQPPCPHPFLPRAPGQGRGDVLCSAARGPGSSTSETCPGRSPAKVRAFLAIAFPQISWLWRAVRTNSLLGPSELLTQPLNLIITMVKVITSSLQYFSHHINVWPLLSGFLLFSGAPKHQFSTPQPQAPLMDKAMGLCVSNNMQ